MRKSRTGTTADAARPSPVPTTPQVEPTGRTARRKTRVIVHELEGRRPVKTKCLTIHADPQLVLDAIRLLVTFNGWARGENPVYPDSPGHDFDYCWLDDLGEDDRVTIPLQDLASAGKEAVHA